ncbi:MAG: hypothetical protein DMG36_06020 [Acidobacteria bacterium]|nr:MAG: hypothetical protein DMG36_06020 [Acidobacteriota bacterium]
MKCGFEPEPILPATRPLRARWNRPPIETPGFAIWPFLSPQSRKSSDHKLGEGTWAQANAFVFQFAMAATLSNSAAATKLSANGKDRARLV